MKIQVNDAENSQKELVVELPYEVLESASEQELTKLIPTVKVPGFRPGKAPKDVIKKQYEHKIRSAAIERVINDALRDAMTSNNIMPLSQANVYDVEFDVDKPIKFKAKVDVFPTVNVENHSGFDFEYADISITDADIDGVIDTIRERNMTYEPAKTRTTVELGDIAVIDFEGKLDGVAFDGGTAKDFSLTIGSGQFIPGFEDAVIGMEVGSEKDIDVTFPAEYQAPDLAGKPVVFTVKLHEIKEKVLPELTDEFVATVDPKLSTVAEFRAKLTAGITEEYTNRARFDIFTDMLNKIMDVNPFDVPYSFAKEQAERMAYQSMNQFYQMGLDPDKVGITFDMMVERHIEQAKNQVKHALIINEIATKQNIIVEDKDLDDFIAHHAAMQGRTPEELRQESESHNMLDNFKNDILGRKVREYLEGLNTVKTIKMTKDEYDKSKDPNHVASEEEKPAKKATKAKTTKAKKDDSADAGEEKPKAKRTTKAKAEDGEEKPKTTRKKKADAAE